MFRTSDVKAFVDAFEGEGDQSKAPVTYTQEQVDKMLGEQKESQKQALSKLQMLEQRVKLTEAEKIEHEKTVEDLRKKVFTSEELREQEIKKRDAEYRKNLDATSGERDAWRNRYSGEKITRAITDAAVTGDAFNPAQIVALLGGNSVLEEIKNEDGQVIDYVPMVQFKTVDKEKKPVTLALTPQQAIERLKGDASYFNLFKSTMKDGLGGGNGAKGSKMTLAEAAKDPEKYRKYRQENGLE